jgi:hypothetical protein
MRWLVLALVVANAAFFTWRYNERLEAGIVAARREATLKPLAVNTPSLTLVSELDELPPRREAPQARTAAPAPVVAAAPDLAGPAPTPPTVAEQLFEAAADPAPAETPVPSIAAPASLSAQVVDEGAAPDTVAVAEMPAGLAVTPAPAPLSSTAAPAEAPTVATRGAPSGTCLHIGPFAGTEEYAALAKWLTPRSTTVNVETVTTTKRQLFWVYLEQKSVTEAQQKRADLARKGVRDTLLVNRDGFSNAISLGVFSSQDAVNRRLAEIERKGYKPVVVPRIETTDMRWLNVELATGFEDKRQIPAALRGNAGVEDLDCSRLAGSRLKAQPRS